MQRSIFIARLLGPSLIAIGLSQLVNADVLRTLADQFLQSYALIFLAGIITLVAGLAIVNTHNLWVSDWRVAITIFGWLAVIGGFVRIVLPQQTATIGSTMLAVPYITTFSGIVVTALGAWLTFMGYGKIKITRTQD
jgi:hypothetical protein